MKLGMICNAPDLKSYQMVKDFGLSFVEICCNFDEESRALNENVPKILANLKATGLTVGSVGRWNSSPNVGGKLDPDQLALIESNMDAAAALGSPVYVCGINYDDSVSRFRNYCVAVDYFGRLLEHAEGKNLKVAVCNCSWNNFVVSPREWEVILGELPELMLKYDCSHAYNGGRDYLKEMSDWGARIAHFHIKGTVKPGGLRHTVDDPPAGMDDLQWGSIFAILYGRGYDGNLSIEPHSHTWQSGTELGNNGIRFTIDYMRRFIFR